jgi:hypothetical protein
MLYLKENSFLRIIILNEVLTYPNCLILSVIDLDFYFSKERGLKLSEVIVKVF